MTLACHLDDSSAVQLLHAIRPLHPNPLRDAEVPERIRREYLARRKLAAHEQLLSVAAAALKCHKRVEVVVREAEPARHAALQESHAKVNLVVVGKRRCSALSDFLCCGVAKRIMAWCQGGLMIVPCESLNTQPESIRAPAITSAWLQRLFIHGGNEEPQWEAPGACCMAAQLHEAPASKRQLIEQLGAGDGEVAMDAYRSGLAAVRFAFDAVGLERRFAAAGEGLRALTMNRERFSRDGKTLL